MALAKFGREDMASVCLSGFISGFKFHHVIQKIISGILKSHVVIISAIYVAESGANVVCY